MTKAQTLQYACVVPMDDVPDCETGDERVMVAHLFTSRNFDSVEASFPE